jgi:DNA polymerase-3 subunit delta
VYLLAGEEEFFIDQISDFIEENVLDEGEREFNQTILYGLDTDVLTVESEAKRYPMMASHNVVIVKEAQNLKKMDALANYAANPSPTTLLVLCHKHKKADGRSKLVKEIKKSGVYFQSNRLYDNQVVPWMEAYVKKNGFSIVPKASALLVEFLGTDLSKISNELDKLMLSLSDERNIDDKAIEENIGISKDYNVFELNNAFGRKDVVRANRIINYFGQNEKGHPLPMIIPAIYRYFSQLLLYHAVKKKGTKEIASALGINPYFLKDYQQAAQYYSIKKIARIISALRRADMNSKGVDANLNAHEVLKELVFEILH